MSMSSEELQGLETRYYKLERLCKWEHRDQVDSMLLSGIAPDKISKWCKEQGFKISKQKLYDYRGMLQESVAKGITVEKLLGMGAPTRVPVILKALGVRDSRDLVKSEMQVLDCVIQLGYNTMSNNPTLKINDALKAIELKHKLTGGNHGGLTEYGMEQLRELEEAKFNAIVKIVLKYVPEDKHEELQEELALAERNFYEQYAPEFIEEYEDAVQQELEKDDEDAVIVSDENS